MGGVGDCLVRTVCMLRGNHTRRAAGLPVVRNGQYTNNRATPQNAVQMAFAFAAVLADVVLLCVTPKPPKIARNSHMPI